MRGQGAELPCGVWGNAPTVPRVTSMPNALNKGAGSEASLPVISRVRRRAPKLLFPPRFREEPIIMKKFAGILLLHGFYLDDRETACKEMEAFLNEIDQ